jgi:hypothetical protein
MLLMSLLLFPTQQGEPTQHMTMIAMMNPKVRYESLIEKHKGEGQLNLK